MTKTPNSFSSILLSPRVAKNFEVLLDAAVTLSKKREDFEVILSTSGNETKQAEKMFAKYGNIPVIKFDGKKTREQVFELFNQIDCMVFPSNLETWGLPITEFKAFNKPMLLPDLKYAHETLGEFDKAKFFPFNDANILANYMSSLIDNKLVFDKNKKTDHQFPFFKNWDELVMFLSTEI